MKVRLPMLSFSVVAIAAGMLAGASASALDQSSTRTVVATHLATAQVTRADLRTGRLTLRTEGQTVVVETDGDSPSIRGLRPGEPVVVGYDVVRAPGRGERHVLVSLHTTSNTPLARSTASVITPSIRVDGQPRTGRVDWSIAQPAPAVPWTTTVAPTTPPARGGIPLTYVMESIPSVPAPTPAPQLALPPSGVAPAVAIGETDLRRLQGERDFEVAAAQLALAAESMDRAWAGHRELCINGPLPSHSRSREWFLLLDGSLPKPDRDDCRVQRDELTRMAQRFRDQVQTAAASAEGADVVPGRIREVLGRHRLDL
jgi:hypothetical protein